jgi:hypothetical protein
MNNALKTWHEMKATILSAYSRHSTGPGNRSQFRNNNVCLGGGEGVNATKVNDLEHD